MPLSSTRVAPLLLVLLAACSSDPGTGSASSSSTSSTGAGGSTGTGPGSGPTFHKDVEPILQQSCQTCHSPGHIAPFSLMTYDDAQAAAGLMVTRTKDRTMPPWGAQETADCVPRLGWRDDKRLSDAAIATIAAWSAAGAPEGDPKDTPAPIPPGVDGLPGATLTLTPQTPFVASGDADQFRCFVLDPKLATASFMNGSHFIAGNPKVVHHALMYLDPDNKSAALAGPDGSYDCFGGSGVSGAQLIAAWAPGGVPSEYPADTGLSIPAGAKLVMQVHYHPAGTTGAPDSTQFQMRFVQGAPKHYAYVTLIGNYSGPMGNGDGLLPGPDDPGKPEFLIPAGAKGHTETMRYTVPAKIGNTPLPPLQVYGIAAHMHYVGVEMHVEVTRPAPVNGEPANECLLETPKWDFNWQRFYDYDAPLGKLPTVRPGDVLQFRCTYDNSTDNAFVEKALLEQKLPGPKDVTLGETTLDEMCLIGVSLVY